MTTTTETAAGTIEIRMYNVGFGDAFRITVRRGADTWRMLVDCGVHSHGAARPLEDSVNEIISDLKEDCGGDPHLDVVVATHHHRDHILGFAQDDWADVDVDEVWVPFVEDETDADAKALREAQTRTAQKLAMLIGERHRKLAANQTEARLSLAKALAMADNSRGNAKATNRLLGREIGFAKPAHSVRYLPDTDESKNTISIDKCGVVAHILGPTRDAAMLKKMDPPKNAGWLTLNLDDVVDAQVDDDEGDVVPTNGQAPKATQVSKPWRLFNKDFVPTEPTAVPSELIEAKRKLRLHALTNDSGLLAAASVLEQSVNNTSLFFVLDIGGVRLLFPGDAQYGAWESVRNDQKSLELISNVDFYKMGHHGSHNATPMSFIKTQWNKKQWNRKPGDTMVPWGLVELWKDSIPFTELIDALTANDHRVIKPNRDTVGDNPANELVETQWWSQLTFKLHE
jgi:beta-lactamase superfamily II metal-dependent hydrolase